MQERTEGWSMCPKHSLALCILFHCLKIPISLISLLLLHSPTFCSRWALSRCCICSSAVGTTLLSAAWWVGVLLSNNTLLIRLMQQSMPSSGFLCLKGNTLPHILKISLEVQDSSHLQTMQSNFYLTTHSAGVSSRPGRRNSPLPLLCSNWGWQLCAKGRVHP